jgi:hypothetical protein
VVSVGLAIGSCSRRRVGRTRGRKRTGGSEGKLVLAMGVHVGGNRCRGE